MDKIEVKIKRLSDTAIVPTYGSEKAAGLDLYADLGYDEEYIEESKGKIESYRLRKTLEIPPHTNKMIGCGLAKVLEHLAVVVGYCKFHRILLS